MNIKRSTLFFLIIFLTLGFSLFQTKYTVLDLETLHKSLRKDINENKEFLHVLNAEWTFLNEPARLKTLSSKYLKLSPVKGEQFIEYKNFQNSGIGEYDRKELDSIITKKIDKSKNDKAKTAGSSSVDNKKSVKKQTKPSNRRTA